MFTTVIGSLARHTPNCLPVLLMLQQGWAEFQTMWKTRYFSWRRTSPRAGKLVAGDNQESSGRVTKIVKKIYDMRSSIVHGAVFSHRDREWLLDNCGDVELCVRQVLVAAVQQVSPAEEDHY